MRGSLRALAGRAAARGLVLLAGGAWVLSPSNVHAHLERSARETTRFFELAVGGRSAQLVYAIAFGEQPANEERRRMDLDHDGLLSSEEEAAFLERLVLRLSEAVHLRLDGPPLRPRWSTRLEMSDRRVGSIAFLVELRALLALTPGVHTFEIEDRLELPQAGQGEVGVKEAVGGRFLDSSRGDSPASNDRLYALAGRARSLLEDRRIRFRFESDGTGPAITPPTPSREALRPAWSPWRWGALVAVGLGFVCAAIWLVRRGRARDVAAGRK